MVNNEDELMIAMFRLMEAGDMDTPVGRAEVAVAGTAILRENQHLDVGYSLLYLAGHCKIDPWEITIRLTP